jgi:hypothetical protein
VKPAKIVPIILAVIVLVAVAVFFTRNRQITNQGSSSPTGKPAAESGGGLFSSIKDAMSKSLSLKCEYNIEDSKSVAYVKGSSIRIEGSWGGGTDSAAIIKNDQIWTWDTKKKEGITMQLKTSTTTQQGVNPDDLINNLEKEKQHCSAAVVPDSVFDPPTDVKFQDLTKLLENTSGVPVIPKDVKGIEAPSETEE